MFAPLNTEEKARLARLPIINRARGSRLYTADGGRWIDCWADGGRAIAGHKPDGISLRLKNEIDRGLFAAYPTRWQNRLIKAMLNLFPGYSTARIFYSLDQALSAIPAHHLPIDPLDVSPDTEFISGPIWGRPLLPHHPRSDYLLPILPLPGLSEAQGMLYAKVPDELPPSDPVSPLILSALTRSCGTLNGKILKERDAIESMHYGDTSSLWELRGPYMIYKGSKESYAEAFENHFSRSILIAPSAHRASVFPLNLSLGELKKLIACHFCSA